MTELQNIDTSNKLIGQVLTICHTMMTDGTATAQPMIHAFVKQVMDDQRWAVEGEREACALVADYYNQLSIPDCARHVAARIRVRGLEVRV